MRMQSSEGSFKGALFGPGGGLTRRTALKRFGAVGAAVLTASSHDSAGLA